MLPEIGRQRSADLLLLINVQPERAKLAAVVLRRAAAIPEPAWK